MYQQQRCKILKKSLEFSAFRQYYQCRDIRRHKYLMEQTMFKVRFHLGAGRFFQQWQIRCGSHVCYFKPEEVTLRLVGCKLRNQPKIAKSIFDGAHKTVCAWVEAQEVDFLPYYHASRDASPIFFNPKKFIHWTNELEDNLDNAHFDTLITNGRRLIRC